MDENPKGGEVAVYLPVHEQRGSPDGGQPVYSVYCPLSPLPRPVEQCARCERCERVVMSEEAAEREVRCRIPVSLLSPLAREVQDHARQLQVLAEASRLFATAGLELGATLQAVASHCASLIGDRCAILLWRSDAQGFEVGAFASRDPDDGQGSLLCTGLEVLSNAGILAAVMRTGKGLLLPVVDPEAIEERTHREAFREFLRQVPVHSLILAPMFSRRELMGLLVQCRSAPGQAFVEADRALLEDLADRAAMAIHNARQAEALRQAVEARNTFLSVASHELKTPLTPMALKLHVLARAAQDQPDSPFVRQVFAYVDTARKQIAKLTMLINDLLDASRISAGRLKLELEPVDAAGLLREVTARFSPAALKCGSALTLEAPESLVILTARLGFEQVASNLVDNAIKYGRGLPITVSLCDGAEGIELTVRDQGIGIGAENLSRIFERFERGVSERNYGGLGLGLYITRSIVEALGGAVRVESMPGVGTTFTVELPRQEEPAEPPHPQTGGPAQ